VEPLNAFYNLRVCNRFFKFVTALPALGASPDAPAIDGSHLNLLWAVPFIGILVSIAIMPLAAASFWHHHFGKLPAGWALLANVPFAVMFGISTAISSRT